MNKLYNIDCRAIEDHVPNNYFHCIITSPPYYALRDYEGVEPSIWGGDQNCDHEWGDGIVKDGISGGNTAKQKTNKGSYTSSTRSHFCLKCGAWEGCLGSEIIPDCGSFGKNRCGCYICNSVEWLNVMHNVLRDDGVLWVNIGDSYTSSGKGGNDDMYKKRHTMFGKTSEDIGRYGTPTKVPDGLKKHERMGIPERFVMAAQQNGWYWRQTIVWHKQAPMPNSMRGTRWEKCRIRVKKSERNITENKAQSTSGMPHSIRWGDGKNFKNTTVWEDCEGCDKCNSNGGYVLKKGQWRPTDAYEVVFMLVRGNDYYSDGEDVKTKGSLNPNARVNMRNVITVATQPLLDKHYASYPTDLVAKFILSSTSSFGCCSKCGKCYARITEVIYLDDNSNYVDTLGWKPTCTCNAVIDKCRVYDPFGGSGRTALSAIEFNREYILTEASPYYCTIADKNIKSHHEKYDRFKSQLTLEV